MALSPIRVLHLEDDPLDAALVRETLRADGLACDIVQVDTRASFEQALRDQRFAIILADYSLPSFDGLSAQRLAADIAPDVPFIFVSGTLGEDIAVERIKSGATDYVIKQRIARLPSAVLRALAETAERIKRQYAEAQLRRLNAELEERVADRTRALAESEERLQAILDHSPASIYIKDREGRYVVANRQTESVFARSRAELIGQTDDALLPSHVTGVIVANDRAVMAHGTPLQFEEVLPGRDGPRVYMSSKFPLRREGEVYALGGISTDITHRKHNEEEVKLARLEAERANHAKSEFLSRMSHDLRTPLNAILGFAQLLDGDSLPPEHAESVKQIMKGGQHLLNLINEVLEIARIEAGHLTLSIEAVRICETVEQATTLVRPLAAARAITVVVEPIRDDLYLLADRHRLSQVLLNLLSNAVKYNRHGGQVTVAVDENLQERCRISVSDTGPGIPEQKRHLLFNPFERLGAEGTPIEGTGLGLTVSKALVERMGGELGLASTIDVGSTFWLDLPPTEEPREIHTPTAATAQAAERPASAGTVLYVEDNPSNVRLLERVLERRPGVRLVHSGTGREGLEMAARLRPDLVLLDMGLPDCSGEALVAQLKQSPETRQLPVVVLSADAMPSHVQRLKEAGILAYLTKPINVTEVLRVVDRTLST